MDRRSLHEIDRARTLAVSGFVYYMSLLAQWQAPDVTLEPCFKRAAPCMIADVDCP